MFTIIAIAAFFFGYTVIYKYALNRMLGDKVHSLTASRPPVDLLSTPGSAD